MPVSEREWGADEIRRARLTVGIGLGTATVCISVGLTFVLVLGNVLAGTGMLTGCVIILAALAGFRKNGRLAILANQLILIDLAMHTANCFSTGGIDSPLITAYMFMPMLAVMLLGNQKAVYIWTFFSLVSIVSLGILKGRGIDLPILYPHDRALLARTVLSVAEVVTAMIFIFVMQVGLDRTLGLLDQKTKDLDRARRLADDLLLNVLPAPIAERLKGGERDIADPMPEITVIFADIVGFTQIAEKLPPGLLIHRLNTIFTAFDGIARRHGIEKIKTIGDCYMAVSGVPDPQADHAERGAEMALDLLREAGRLSLDGSSRLQIRIGLHTGPGIAGIVGSDKFIYDLWGDTVNTASRMESHGTAEQIQCTQAIRDRLHGRFEFQYRGEVHLKGKGPTPAYYLLRRHHAKGEAPSRR